jgi:hypothetical protein
MNTIFNGSVSYVALTRLTEINETELKQLKLPDRPKLATRWLAFLGWKPAQKDCSAYKAAVQDRRSMLDEVRRILLAQMSEEVANDCANREALGPLLRNRSVEDMTERVVADSLLQVGVALRVHATDTQHAPGRTQLSFDGLHPSNKLRLAELKVAAYHVITDLIRADNKSLSEAARKLMVQTTLGADFQPSVRRDLIHEFTQICARASQERTGLRLPEIKELATAFLTERGILAQSQGARADLASGQSRPGT